MRRGWQPLALLGVAPTVLPLCDNQLAVFSKLNRLIKTHLPPIRGTAPNKNARLQQRSCNKGESPTLGRTFALPSPYLRRFILGFRYEIRG